MVMQGSLVSDQKVKTVYLKGNKYVLLEMWNIFEYFLGGQNSRPKGWWKKAVQKQKVNTK